MIREPRHCFIQGASRFSGSQTAVSDVIANPCDPAKQLVTSIGLPRAKRGVGRLLFYSGVLAAVLVVLGVLIWQAVTASGNPDPTVANVSFGAAILDTGVLVFREGLEAILVLAALTASLARTEEQYWKPVALGAGASFLATVATWFIVAAIIDSSLIANNISALNVQAATGLLAIVVLLVIMNWFFHKIYWTGWITHHNRRKKSLTASPTRSRAAVLRGLALIGFTSVYREGFEIVLFLQSIRLKFMGTHVILLGIAAGLALTLIVAFLTFVVHYRLPYKRMLVVTGIMLGVVLLVMVGEQVQEMQQANWISSHNLNWPIPDWAGLWFSVFPNVESLVAQVAAATFVIGSYYLARRVCNRPAKAGFPIQAECIVPDCDKCELATAPDAMLQRESGK
jgi:high-affinity iron transporter